MSKQNSEWIYKRQVDMPLHVINLYRKVFMSDVGSYKLNIQQYTCTDPFIVREFIEQRLRQIPLNQDFIKATFELNVTNTIYQEMCITTDHLRVDGKSAVKSGACGKFLICKLAVSSSLQITLNTVHDRPKNNDIFRCGMFIATEVPGHQYKIMSHIRDKSICTLHAFGTLSRQYFASDRLVSKELRLLIDQYKDDVQVVISGQFVFVKFGRLPGYLLDPVMCVIMPDLKKIGNQVYLNQYQNAITIGVTIIASDDILQYIYEVVLKAIYYLYTDVYDFETQFTYDI